MESLVTSNYSPYSAWHPWIRIFDVLFVFDFFQFKNWMKFVYWGVGGGIFLYLPH